MDLTPFGSNAIGKYFFGIITKSNRKSHTSAFFIFAFNCFLCFQFLLFRFLHTSFYMSQFIDILSMCNSNRLFVAIGVDWQQIYFSLNCLYFAYVFISLTRKMLERTQLWQRNIKENNKKKLTFHE